MRTPYNSLNTLSISQSESTTSCDGLICCTHGRSCDFTCETPVVDDDENKYVNLAEVSPSEQEREKLIAHMKNDLQFSDFFASKKKKNKITKTDAKSKGNKEGTAKKITSKYTIPDEELFPRKDSGSSKNKRTKAIAKDSLESASTHQKNTSKFDNIFLGARTFSTAEQAVKKEGDFRLYHRLPADFELDDLEQEARLYMVYKLKGPDRYRHYPVCSRTFPAKSYFVDYGDPRACGYSSLDGLIRAFKKIPLSELDLPLPTTTE